MDGGRRYSQGGCGAVAPRGGTDLVVINQVTGPLMVELLTDLSRRGIRCAAITGWVDAEDPRRLPFAVLRGPRLVKSPAWKRLLTWAAFSVAAILRAIARPGALLLAVSNPPWPMLLMPLLKRLLRRRYVLLIYDVYPDVLVRMGRLRPGGVVTRLWKGLSRRALLHADGVITLGRHMAETIRGHLRPGDRCDVEVIPNWADTDFIRPVAKEHNPFARQHGLVDKFVVIYSGAFGATHDVESIVAAAGLLRDLPDVHFMMIGGGTRRREVEELIAQERPPNLTLLPFQPIAVLPYSLSAADCSIVCLDEGYEGISVPSKTYYALAAGTALLAASAPATELSELVDEHRCGLHIPPRSPGALADAIRRLHDEPELLGQMKAAARAAAEARFSRSVITARYLDYLRPRMERTAP